MDFEKKFEEDPHDNTIERTSGSAATDAADEYRPAPHATERLFTGIAKNLNANWKKSFVESYTELLTLHRSRASLLSQLRSTFVSCLIAEISPQSNSYR